jgi:hypothetical protein
MHVDEIMAMAKEFVLKDGKHGPTLFVETDAQIVIAGLANLPPTPEERQDAFIAVGRKFRQDHPDEQLREILYIMLAWTSLQKVGDPAPRVRPSQDPQRKEMLVMTHAIVTGATATYSTQLLEVIRPTKKTADLVQLPAPIKEGGNTQLDLFIAAYHNPLLPDAAIRQYVRDARGPA